ncbi:DUF1905 domain-containing protein [Antrihabitans sp. NCIMB 15449]|uniref:DUF1905 domain-containing protein n=1 Tax=Antrihabitans spumae TaxID=3373370 RepID=A0ABW7JKL1_9NOCA
MSTAKIAHPIDLEFTAPIEKNGAFATFLTVPNSAEYFGTRRAIKVSGTVDGHPFDATLMPSGSGPHWMPMRAAMCKQIGKAKAGVEVTVRLQQRLS